jgi:hypothetical protein
MTKKNVRKDHLTLFSKGVMTGRIIFPKEVMTKKNVIAPPLAGPNVIAPPSGGLGNLG